MFLRYNQPLSCCGVCIPVCLTAGSTRVYYDYCRDSGDLAKKKQVVHTTMICFPCSFRNSRWFPADGEGDFKFYILYGSYPGQQPFVIVVATQRKESDLSLKNSQRRCFPLPTRGLSNLLVLLRTGYRIRS